MFRYLSAPGLPTRAGRLVLHPAPQQRAELSVPLIVGLQFVDAADRGKVLTEKDVRDLFA